MAVMEQPEAATRAAKIPPAAVELTTVPGGVCAPLGFQAAGVRCGIKRKRRDVGLVVCDGPAISCAGVFTQNVVRAPSVTRDEVVLASGGASAVRAIIVNAGNANAGNGAQGETDNAQMAQLAARALGLSPDAVLTASTGVIGTPLPMELLAPGINAVAQELARSPQSAARAAEAIMTTDTFTKEFAVAVRLPNSQTVIHIGGMSKGSGMIAPNMATMLGFLTTDAAVPPRLLDLALRRAVDVSFNCLTVDGDTSTNDACFALASGASGALIENEEGADFGAFVFALSQVALRLAREIARDGEGATKLVTVRVTGTQTVADARKVAKTISESPLVKTALFGNDPNWGRILAAAGRAGVHFDPNRATATLAGVRIFAHGSPTRFDAAALSKAMAVKELEIAVDLGQGAAHATFYTCDLSYDYVRINAEYHT